MSRRLIGLLALAAALSLVAAACGGDGDSSGGSQNQGGATSSPPEEEEGGTVTINGESANDHGSEDVSGQDELQFEADDFYFEPTVLKGEAGQKIELEIENEGNVTHNFSISEQNIDQDIEAGEDVKVDVTFPDSGQLVFFCAFHRSQGMLGALEVA